VMIGSRRVPSVEVPGSAANASRGRLWAGKAVSAGHALGTFSAVFASAVCNSLRSSPPRGYSLTVSTASGRSPSGWAALSCCRLTDQDRICAASVAANPGSAAPACSSAACCAGSPAEMPRARLSARSSPNQPSQPKSRCDTSRIRSARGVGQRTHWSGCDASTRTNPAVSSG
jgi:hypothetical protein